MKNRSKKRKLYRMIGNIAEWLVYIFAYTLVFIFMDYVFDSFVVDETHFIFYSFVAVVLIYVLNKTVKPILFLLTLPITGVTLGLFYFVNNMIILKLVEFIMNNRVEFTSLPILFFICVFMSAMNLLIENIVVKPFIKKVKMYE
jgi:putative membrane protein